MNQLSIFDYCLKEFYVFLCMCNNKISLIYENVNSTNFLVSHITLATWTWFLLLNSFTIFFLAFYRHNLVQCYWWIFQEGKLDVTAFIKFPMLEGTRGLSFRKTKGGMSMKKMWIVYIGSWPDSHYLVLFWSQIERVLKVLILCDTALIT